MKSKLKRPQKSKAKIKKIILLNFDFLILTFALCLKP